MKKAVDAMREAFDAAFAAAPAEERRRAGEALLVDVGGEPAVIRLDQCAGVFRAPALLRLPGTRDAYRGVATIDGVIVPVFDLASLAGGKAAESPGMLVLSAGRHAVGCLVDRVDGTVEFEGRETEIEGGARAVRAGGKVRRVIDLGRLVEDLGRTRSDR